MTRLGEPMSCGFNIRPKVQCPIVEVEDEQLLRRLAHHPTSPKYTKQKAEANTGRHWNP